MKSQMKMRSSQATLQTKKFSLLGQIWKLYGIMILVLGCIQRHAFQVDAFMSTPITRLSPGRANIQPSRPFPPIAGGYPRQLLQQQPTTTKTRLYKISGIELADLIYDSTDMAFNAWEWTANIGAPAALVAGAVLVTLSETRPDTAPRKSDSKKIRILKLGMRFLLLTSFALEVVSIFVSTMTGSVLLGHGPQEIAKKMVGYGSPLQLMHYHHEFEYLTTQICFLQGLFNWLAAVAVELYLPKEGETKSAKRMNKCLVSWLVSMMIWMLAFYNHHLSFYADYFTMIRRVLTLFVKQYLCVVWPWSDNFRPLSWVYLPGIAWSSWLTYKAFRSPPDDDDD